LGKVTSYTEMNTVLSRRTGFREFDFTQDGERHAMGQLLVRITEQERQRSGHMISSLVHYLDENDAGPGFYKFAQELGVLAPSAKADEKLVFWAAEVQAMFDYYRHG